MNNFSEVQIANMTINEKARYGLPIDDYDVLLNGEAAIGALENYNIDCDLPVDDIIAQLDKALDDSKDGGSSEAKEEYESKIEDTKYSIDNLIEFIEECDDVEDLKRTVLERLNSIREDL